MNKIFMVMISVLFLLGGCASKSKLLKHGEDMYQKGIKDVMKTFDTCMEEGRKVEDRFNQIVNEYNKLILELRKYKNIQEESNDESNPNKK